MKKDFSQINKNPIYEQIEQAAKERENSEPLPEIFTPLHDDVSTDSIRVLDTPVDYMQAVPRHFDTLEDMQRLQKAEERRAKAKAELAEIEAQKIERKIKAEKDKLKSSRKLKNKPRPDDAKRLNIYWDNDLNEYTTIMANTLNITKQEFLNSIVREHMNNNPMYAQLKEFAKQMQKGK